MIDTNSPTWAAIDAWISQEIENNVKDLIADRRSEQARGAINQLERLIQFSSNDLEIIETDTYTS